MFSGTTTLFEPHTTVAADGYGAPVPSRPFRPALARCVGALALLGAACGSSADPAASSAATTTVSPPSTTGAPATTTSAAAAPTTTVAAGAANAVTNVWSTATVDPTKLPLGDGKVSTSGPARGSLFACSAGNPNGPGASKAGTWIDTAGGTWDATRKIAVQGSRTWESADYTETVSGANRVLTTNALPVKTVTGTFPIAASDPAYQFDRNPNSIKAQSTVTITLPVRPEAAATPSCLPMGAIGIMRNGVFAFASLDERNRDAVAWETQDVCDGHPQQTGVYHYHNVPSCLRDAAPGASVVVGYALDGHPIVVERDATGRLPTNADLDECHGRTSPIVLDGAVVTRYHYSATLEFPYFIGCYRGTPRTP